MKGKCKKCMHRHKKYCKAYQFDIDMLNVDNCKRFKKIGRKK